MRKKNFPAIAAGAVILLILLIILIAVLIKKYSPSKEVMNLSDYYKISEENTAAILLNHTLLENQAVLEGEELYLDFDFVHQNLSSRFYWDHNENLLLYATADALFTAEVNSSSYTKDKKQLSHSTTILKADANTCYISISYLKEFLDFEYQLEKNPNRVLITTDFSDIQLAVIKKDCKLRNEPSIKAPILTELKKEQKVTILSEDSKWTKIITDDGITGYMENKRIRSKEGFSFKHETTPEEFIHVLKNQDVCLGWHLLDYRAGSEVVAAALANIKGVNVLSPTWFKLVDGDGTITDIGSEDYVKYCHNQGIEVWALINDFEATEENAVEKVLTRTSTRQYLVNQLVSKALSYNLDGINVDFESIQEEYALDFLQFIRELAIKCHKNGISVSVDSYMPAAWNQHLQMDEQALFADYVVLMGYDEHWNGSEPGSVSSLPWVKEGVATTLSLVPENQVILGMPFYTRMWTYTPNENYETSDVIDLETCYTMSSKAYTMSGIYNVIGTYADLAEFDEEANQYVLEYTDGYLIRKVWLETIESTEGRMKVMDENNLAGCAFWRIGQEKQEVWDIIIKYLH